MCGKTYATIVLISEREFLIGQSFGKEAGWKIQPGVTRVEKYLIALAKNRTTTLYAKYYHITLLRMLR
jgi:hypothetical protein